MQIRDNGCSCVNSSSHLICKLHTVASGRLECIPLEHIAPFDHCTWGSFTLFVYIICRLLDTLFVEYTKKIYMKMWNYQLSQRYLAWTAGNYVLLAAINLIILSMSNGQLKLALVSLVKLIICWFIGTPHILFTKNKLIIFMFWTCPEVRIMHLAYARGTF